MTLIAVEFDEEVTWDQTGLRKFATFEGRRIECNADLETLAELDGRLHPSGIEIGEEKMNISPLLHPYFVRKIEAGQFDDDSHKAVTVHVDELLSFMQGG
jgi:hypothetical protein